MSKTITALLAVYMAMIATVCYSQESPRTTVAVTINAEVQTIRTGPYARFAQKYLGVIAPLADKQLATITSASLSYFQGESAAGSADNTLSQPVNSDTGPISVSHTRNAMEFTKVPVDRRDFTERSLEEAAREAAGTIFSIRKHRMELITGMAGENVFGAGLPAALEELERLEEEYLSLFMGKQSVQALTRVYNITPEAGQTNRVVCRWSDTDGLLPEADLSGSPIVLEMRPVEIQAPPPSPASKPAKNAPPMVRQYIPAPVNCRLLDSKRELAFAQIPIYQMGTYVEVPVGTVR